MSPVPLLSSLGLGYSFTTLRYGLSWCLGSIATVWIGSLVFSIIRFDSYRSDGYPDWDGNSHDRFKGIEASTHSRDSGPPNMYGFLPAYLGL